MKKVLSGLGQAVMNKEDPKEKLEKIRKEIETNGERLEKGLRTFFFNADTKGAYKNVINAMALSAFSHLSNASEAIKDLTSLASRGFSSFYLLGTDETNISESVNNEVGDSMLKQVLDKGSAVSREISFSLGGGGGETGLFLHGLAGYVSAMDFPGAETIGSNLNTAITSAGKAASDILGDSMVKIITQGSQLIFPRVWQSSAFTKSVQIQCRFYSPFGHPDAIRKYVINPALVILGFSIPIQDSASTYRYPFLVQLDSPGANATRMGIVSEISIKRGGKYDALRYDERKVIVAFEGMDAAGKGGAIKRIVKKLDPREYEIHSIAAPERYELRRPYLWRFWNKLNDGGKITIFDRTWYGRVLVERIEGFASVVEWQRAYNEINRFEENLVDSQTVIVKIWLAISKDEQEVRFKDREQTPHKRFKITEEDWRNRDKWDDYLKAAADMFERTNTDYAPWYVIATDDKNTARIEVLKAILKQLKAD
jgi:polyphosphate kinase 2 (PPK2 family)